MRRAATLAALACLGAAAPAPSPPTSSPVTQLAGRYGRHFQNALADGTRYWSDDVVEIVPVDKAHAYVRLRLEYANGHLCAFSGVTSAAGPELVYREPPAPAGYGRCRLHIHRNGASLALDDEDGTCSDYCGARGTLRQVALPWTSRRPITYLPRLKASTQYQEAISAWRKNEGRK